MLYGVHAFSLGDDNGFWFGVCFFLLSTLLLYRLFLIPSFLTIVEVEVVGCFVFWSYVECVNCYKLGLNANMCKYYGKEIETE